MAKKTVQDIEVNGRRVLVRVDFNVPMENGAISDDTRIRAALPTIRLLAEGGAKVILMSHLEGKDKVDPKTMTMDAVAARLQELLDRPVQKVNDSIGPEVEAAVQSLVPGQVLLLENTRHHAGEKKNDPEYAAALAKLGDVFVDDAFGTAHRAHASNVGVADHLEAVSGLLMQKELEILGGALDEPKRPFVAILGGAKVKDKIKVIENLLPKVDTLIIGGGMAYTFLKAMGHEIGKSLLDESFLARAGEVAQVAKENGWKLALPVDVVVTDHFREPTMKKTVSISEIPADLEGVDIGPETIARFQEILKDAKTVVWNGPMGVFETPDFAVGTRAIGEALAGIAQNGANVIIGGGDSAAAVEQFDLADQMTHISTGGGASLEFLEGKELPGVAALSDK